MRFCTGSKRSSARQVVVFGGLSLLAMGAAASDYKLGKLQIEHPYTLATPIAGGTAIGYLRIENGGASDDTLLGAGSADAAQVQIHQMTMEGGLMRMRPQSNGVRLPAKSTVDFGPDAASGYHLMLIGVKRQLKPGEEVPLTLHFAHAGAVQVEFAVQPLAPPITP